jgi:D-alanyl-D-alanine carboxypeptidase (penicillin-binding protein 5/6)
LKRVIRIVLPVAAAALAGSPTWARAEAPLPPQDEVPIALLVDISSGQTLVSRDEDRRFLPASVTKVMSVYIAFEMLADGRLKADQSFTVSQEVADQWSGTGSSMFLRAGEKVSVDQLLHGITTVSANDGCIALAEGAAGSMKQWVALMNRAARQLGMDDSHYGTPNGWPDEGNTFVTARDMVKLARAMITRYPKLYARYFGHRGLAFNGIAQANHDPITGVVKGADGIKTGFTREAGNNFLGSAQRGGRRLAMVVAGIDDAATRAQVSRALIEWGFGAFAPRQLFAKGAEIGEARVQGGAARHVALRAAEPVIVDYPNGKQPALQLTVHYQGPLVAPISAGDRVAELEVSLDGFAPYRVPLIAGNDVAKANSWQRLRNGVLGWLP